MARLLHLGRHVFFEPTRTRLLYAVVTVLAAACGDDSSRPSIDAGRDAGVDAARPPDARPVDAFVPVDMGPPPSLGLGPYGENGPIAFTTRMETVTNGSSSFRVTVYLPSSPGLHPLVSLSCGSTQTAAPYVPYG